MTSCKYGFLTTYNETVFLKQEPHPNHEGEFVLWHSNIIHHNTFFKDVKSKDPLHFHGRVSLRECFLYFAFKAAKEPYTPYPRIRTQWVGRHQDTYSGNFIPEHEGVVPKYAVVPRLPPPPGQTQLVDRTLRSSTARATEREHRPQGLFSHHPASNRSIGTTPDPYPILPEDDTHRGSLYPKGRQEGKPGRLTSPFEPMPMEKKRRTAFEGYDYGRAHRQSQVQQPHMPVTDRRGLATLEIRRGKYYFRSADERLVRVDLEIRTNSRGECERYFVWQDVEYIVKKFREYDDDEF